tara:strand:+ start:124 stop:336 length:213 start_codon:yes stop_codon:yes gene_type:complete
MPVKFKPSAKEYSRATGKTTTTHYYIKSTSKKDLFEALNNHNTKPKVKQKIRNELVRRGIKIVWRVPSET